MRILALLCLLIGAVTLSLCLGDVFFTPAQIFATLAHPHAQLADAPAGLSEIVWQIRLPRLLIAAVVGCALSVSGYILQTLSRNQLADPYLTGVSSGAGLAIAAAMYFGLDFAAMPGAAFMGGLAASAIVAFMARSPSGLSVTKLLLAGVGLSAICAAFITLILTNAPSVAQAQGLFFWLAGGIGGRTWSELGPAASYAAIGFVVALAMSKQLRLLSMGTQSAQALGLDVARAQWTLLSAAVLMCGAAVSISGLVGFVGLIAPHVSRRLYGRDERLQIFCTAAVGVVLVLVSDLAARTLGQGQELPLGTLLSLLGGPFFLFLISHQHGDSP
ncbi:MAG TPA: iron ABC transporter permease [Planktothrix sp.]